MSKRCEVNGCKKPYYSVGFCHMHYQRNHKYGSPHGGIANHAPPSERFWRHVEKSPGCWVWKAGTLKSGYGNFSVSRTPDKCMMAHRFSYELQNVRIPNGLVVMHSCDNKLCVNPKHLSLGTRRDNTQDMIAKGRRARLALLGTDNGKAKLTPAKVRIIRASSGTNKALADRWGLSVNAIRGVRIGRTWSHVK